MEFEAVTVEIARLALGPDDVLIVRPRVRQPTQTLNDMQDWLNACPPLQQYRGRIIVVPSEIELLVVSKDRAPA